MKKVTLIFIFLFLLKGAKAITFFEDSIKTKYDLNDPRNPNCPCHKYQKLADEEFAKLNKGVAEQKITTSQNSTGFASSGTTTHSITKTKHFKNLVFSHHRNKSYKIFNFNRGPRGKKRHFVRTNKNISSCFRWK